MVGEEERFSLHKVSNWSRLMVAYSSHQILRKDRAEEIEKTSFGSVSNSRILIMQTKKKKKKCQMAAN